MKKLEKFWDERSQKYGTKVEGVLLKSVPDTVNTCLHRWMLDQISKNIANKEDAQVLDLGCGYGRLSGELLKRFSKIKTVGVDIAANYVDLYNRNLAPRGKAIKGDICCLPFKDGTFDMVFIVTTLMYLPDDRDQKKALAEIGRVLKPGGHFLVVERNPLGYGIFTLGGLISKVRDQRHSEIPAVSIDPDKISQLMANADLKLTQKEGIPFFTIFFFPLLTAVIINKYLGGVLLNLINKADNIFKSLVKPSLYIAYSGVKDEI